MGGSAGGRFVHGLKDHKGLIIRETRETLDMIAFNELGDASAWRNIANLNRIANPLSLRRGRVLVVDPEE